ncbi:hypothetical protein P0Y35_15685 [Kiritimatiellaeota bacterium B1221]|nr:hypothetical protein [Kiritimatiellaeota bacterium B1221]
MTIRSIYPESTQEPIDSYTVVIDGKDMVAGRSESDQLSAREQVEILQKLVKIQKSEDWEIWVLFNGEPLHQVEHGGDFLGIRVFFSPTPPQRIPTLLECVKVLSKSDQKTLMVTNDPNLESRAIALGASTLRADTLKKGFESLFVNRSRPHSRLMRHRTVDQRKSQLRDDDGPDIRDLVDLV